MPRRRYTHEEPLQLLRAVGGQGLDRSIQQGAAHPAPPGVWGLHGGGRDDRAGIQDEVIGPCPDEDGSFASNVRHETDESALMCQSHALIPPLECGVCGSATPPMSTMLAQGTCSITAASAPRSSASRALKSVHSAPRSGDAGRAFLAMPFDAMRFQYAGAVMAGLARRSIVASGKLERALDALERLILGPLARQR